jgi:hypothetical protein
MIMMSTLLFISGLELVIIVMIIPLIALIDILRSEFSGNNKLIWVLVVLFFPLIGTILYFLIGRGQKVIEN